MSDEVLLLDENGEETLYSIDADGKVGSKKDQNKKGGSNAGKYNKSEGPFCGPSGGAPKGTYPVGSKARARAALKLAHNAPNPAGIRACVYRHYPDLKPKAKSTDAVEEHGIRSEDLLDPNTAKYIK